MLHKKTLLFAAFSAAFFSTTMTQANAAVVASLKPLGFIASAIADGVTPTEVLLPDGASEHDYALRPSDAKRLRNADLVVWIGPEMEAFMDKTATAFPESKKVTISMLPGVKPLLIKGADDDEHDHDHDHGTAEKGDEDHHHGEYNMHLWLSPEIARLSAVAIHDKLVELMPQSRAKL
ncbi:metal ABC transporter solute-binding protein, Zn/Mn family, partial [Scandinavium sp.]|uniref:metal ABC transporter solute-binding protein, Zn/Mn family n=1 Tax=Scandinavium sp. TaxID=2830653 RepID=UPI00289FC67F